MQNIHHGMPEEFEPDIMHQIHTRISLENIGEKIMEGSNKIIMCKFEMNKAIQHYLDKVIFSEQESGINIVDSVNYLNNDSVFEIRLMEEEKTNE